MMVSCNKVLDRFYFKVLKKLYPKVASDDLSTFHRFCNLSIFTSGNTNDCTDSFLNTPHNDTTDVLFKKFQRTAQELLGDLRKKDPENHCLDVDIDYLERLSVACGGFAVPTTCGYDFVTSKKVLQQHSGSFCHDWAWCYGAIVSTVLPLFLRIQLHTLHINGFINTK